MTSAGLPESKFDSSRALFFVCFQFVIHGFSRLIFLGALAGVRGEQMGRGRLQVLLALLLLTHAAAAPSRRHHGHSGHHLKNVTVRVRACDAPIKIANLGYLGPTKMNHLEYFSRAYAQPRYRSAAAASSASATTAGDCRDANFAIASVLAERFRAHQAKEAG